LVQVEQAVMPHQARQGAHHACSVLLWIYVMPVVAVVVSAHHPALWRTLVKVVSPWVTTVAAMAVALDKQAAMREPAAVAAQAATPAMVAMAEQPKLHLLLVAVVAVAVVTKVPLKATVEVASDYKVKVQAAQQDLVAAAAVAPAERLAPTTEAFMAVAVVA
jgi:hypothetical protein